MNTDLVTDSDAERDFAYSVNWLNDQQARRYPMASAAL
jgi:hypothetical protein